MHMLVCENINNILKNKTTNQNVPQVRVGVIGCALQVDNHTHFVEFGLNCILLSLLHYLTVTGTIALNGEIMDVEVLWIGA